jgi:hypothetical protein
MDAKPKEIEASPSTSTGSSARDDNYDLYKQNQGLEYTREEEKKVIRKIDLQLIPLLFVIYMLQVSGRHSVRYYLLTLRSI